MSAVRLAPAAIDWSGVRRLLPAAAIAILVIVDVGVWLAASSGGRTIPGYPADFDLYVAATRSWLAGDGFYHAYQLVGPYDVWQMADQPILYPPPVLALLVPFSVLPVALWIAIPVAGTALVVVSHRPSRIGWLVIAALALFPGTYFVIATANPALWVVFFCALATRWPFFGPFVLLKPTLAPWSLVGVWSRWWWAGLAVFAAVSLALLPLWPEYVTAVLNSRQKDGLLYGFWNNLTIAIPVVAWWTGELRQRRHSSRSRCA